MKNLLNNTILKVKQIDFRQDKKLAIAATIVAVFWIFMYMGYRGNVKKVKEDLTKIRQQTNEFQERLKIAKEVKLVQEQIKVLYETCPRKEEDGLKIIFNFAKARNIEIGFIEPKPRQPFVDSDNKKLIYSGKSFQSVSVALIVKCTYTELVNFLKDLNKELSGFIIVERLLIKHDESEQANREAELDLKLFLLS